MLKGLKKVLILKAIKNSLPLGQKHSTLKSAAINQGLFTLGSIGLGLMMKNRRAQKSAAINQGLLTLGSIGVGAGLMYLLDPDLGHRRRINMREKITRGVKVPSRPNY